MPGLDKVPGAVDRGNTALAKMATLLRGLAAGFGVLALTKMADEWAGVEGRIATVTNGVQEQRAALSGLYDIAQATGQEYAATAGLFQSVQRNAKELSLTLADSLKLTDTIGKALTMGGGSQASQQAALTQLGQALGSGALRGDELNSIMEQSPRLAQAIAEAFGTTVGKLRDLGKAGKLTSKELAKGLLKQSEKLNGEFERMPMTFGRAFTRLKNSLGQQVDTFNKNTKAAELFYKVTSLIVDNLADILKWVVYIGAAAGLTKLVTAARVAGGLMGVLAARMRAIGGARAFGVLLGTFARMLAIVTAIEYVFDDVFTWLKGGDSLIGDILGPTSDWKWLTEGVRDVLKEIKDLMGDNTESVTTFVAKWGLLAVVVLGIVAAIGLIPTIVLAVIIAFAGFFNYLRKNWESIKTTVAGVGQSMADSINQAWEDIKQRAIQVWGEISKVISDAVPDFVKKGFAWQGQVIGEGFGNLRSLGEMAGVIPTRPGTGAAGPVNQTANVTVNAQTNTPAAVADAARRGTQSALSSASLPQVEVAR